MVRKKAQYKIQQMAFMILAIFFFFILVGLFFVGWQYSSMKKNYAFLQEEKALSALKVIADSTELNCEQSEDWCIDRDKLIAFSENSDLYQDFFSVASIELLLVYPKRGEGFYNSTYEPVKNVVDCPGNYGDYNGDSYSDQPINDLWAVYSFISKQGPIEHLPTAGDALRPELLFDNLNSGEKVRFQDITGTIDLSGVEVNCGSSSSISLGNLAVAGFYSGTDELISEFPLSDFTSTDGLEVPSGATKLYVYFKASEANKNNYNGYDGGCSLSVRKIGWESCYSDGVSLSNTPISDDEPILCPAPYCDYYILYDSGQTDKRTFSAYVNVCEQIDRSHEICQLAKLMLGVKILDS